MERLTNMTREEYYNGRTLESFELDKHRSCYNHNYFYGYNGESVFAQSDDCGWTEYSYFENGRWIAFAESFVENGNIIECYNCR